MDVRCPKCQTLYELDDTQVKTPTITLKCSQCQYVFKHETRLSTAVQENHRRWMVRKRKTGDILYCNAFDVLHQWIMSGQVSKRDAISRTGNKWTELGQIGEFVPVFQVVESISNLTGQPLPEDSAIAIRKISEDNLAALAPPQPAPAPPQHPHAHQVPNRERVRTALQFGQVSPPEEVTQRARPSRMTPAAIPAPLPPNPREIREERQPTPAAPVPVPVPTPQAPTLDGWELGGDVPHTHLTSEVTSQTEIPRSKAPLWIGLLVIAAGIAYLMVFQRPLVDSLLGTPTESSVVSLGNTGSATNHATESPTALNATAAQASQKTAAAEPSTANQPPDTRVTQAIDATRPALHHALGVATEETELAAESGNVENKLTEARRTLERGRAPQALNLFKQVLDAEPRNATAITGVGWCYIEMGRFEDAASNFRRALDIDPKQGDALIGLGTAERQRGNFKAAHDAYDLYLGRHPKGPKASIARYQLDALRKQLGL